jgi:hypothetical protein
VEERVYEGEFDDVKTDAGERQVPFDKRGLMKSALIGRWNASKHRQPNDLVFCTRKGKGKGGPSGRRNLLRHIKAAATKLGLSSAVDFRSFRSMHSSLIVAKNNTNGMLMPTISALRRLPRKIHWMRKTGAHPKIRL